MVISEVAAAGTAADVGATPAGAEVTPAGSTSVTAAAC